MLMWQRYRLRDLGRMNLIPLRNTGSVILFGSKLCNLVDGLVVDEGSDSSSWCLDVATEREGSEESLE